MKKGFIFAFLGGLAVLGADFSGVLAGEACRPKDPEKELIRRTDRPQNYETPIESLNSLYTPNQKFFVRNHLPGRLETPLKDWRLTLEGEGFEKPLSLSVAQLKKDFKVVEVSAVGMCAGNRRSQFDPRVPGVQWGNGAVGNARWKGVRLKDVLQKAGLKTGVVEIAFNGADYPALPTTPDFVKSIPIEKAMDDSTLIAFEMNGEPLPEPNGYPIRVIVPGWVSSYWVKHLVSVQALTKPADGFWMQKAYRIEKGKFPAVEKGFPSQENDKTAAISELVVNSLITSPVEGAKFSKGQSVKIQGVAWDGGHGIQKVEVSVDGGKTWSVATLGKDAGRYSWRQFSYELVPSEVKTLAIMARATSETGQTQPETAVHNPSGYHNNSIQVVHLEAI